MNRPAREMRAGPEGKRENGRGGNAENRAGPNYGRGIMEGICVCVCVCKKRAGTMRPGHDFFPHTVIFAQHTRSAEIFMPQYRPAAKKARGFFGAFSARAFLMDAELLLTRDVPLLLLSREKTD